MIKQPSFVLLDWKIAQEFHEQAKKQSEYPSVYGKMAVLKEELINLCGVTEIEAINILCGRNVEDYINKYIGRAEGRTIDIKEYEGEIQVVYKITEDEKYIYED